MSLLPRFPVMNNSPFRRIVLPALLASSTGFVLLTWPLASRHADQRAAPRPEATPPWGLSILTTIPHKDFSIRYIGFAILSSVALGIGTAEALRGYQSRRDRHQKLLQTMLSTAISPAADLAAAGLSEGGMALADNYPQNLAPLGLDHHPDTTPVPPLAWPLTPTMPLTAMTDSTVITAKADQPLTFQPTATLDWASLLQTAATDQATLAPSSTAALPTAHPMQGADHPPGLAVQVEGQDYHYYRRQPTLAKAQALVQRLHRQGQAAITTHDQAGYVVWVQSGQVSPSSAPLT
jgi:hypothetical protein